MTKATSTIRTARMAVNPVMRRLAAAVVGMVVGLSGIATSAGAAEPSMTPQAPT